MKKISFPKYSKVALIMSGVFLGIYFFIKVLEKFNVYIYLFRLSTEEITPIIITLCIAFLISAAAVLFYKNTRRKTLVVILTTIFSLLLFSYMHIIISLSMNGTYFEYTSDDKKHDIVVNECSFLLVGFGDVYEKTSFCTMKRVGGYTTDGGFYPFTNNAFYFVWNEKDFELHLSFFGSLDEEHRVVKMEYAK